MPRIFKPRFRTSGPGSAFGTSNPFAKKCSGQEKDSVSASSQTPPQILGGNENNETKRRKYIGEDLVNCIDETQADASAETSNDNLKKAEKEEATTAKNSSPNIKTNQEEVAGVDNSASISEIVIHQALGLDTRCLQTFSTTGLNVCSEFTRLLRTLEARGAPLKHVAMDIPSNNYNSKGAVGIKVLRSDQFKQEGECMMIKPLVLASESPPHVSQSDSTVSVPKTLGARYSWKILGEMVNAIQLEHAKCMSEMSDEQENELSALVVTLITSDLALFCDINTDAHKKAVGGFLNRVVPLLRHGKVRSIHIVMAQTGVMGMPADQESSATGEDVPLSLSSARENHAFATARSVRAIQHELSTFRSADLEHVMSNSDAPLPSLDISFYVIDHCTAGYRLLSRQLSRHSLTGSSTLAKLTIRLPELDDGTQCSVHMDGSYPIIPGNVRSTSSARHWKDLQILSGSTLTPIQALPHSSIDASLLYGLPIRITPGCEDDFAMTREMEVLTRSLFDWLEKEKLALLLSASIPGNIGADDTVFHTSGEQIFLLMPQGLSDSSIHSVSSGILFRYATADDLLLEAAPRREEIVSEVDIESQYTNYIERAMDSIAIRAYNPLADLPENEE